MPYASWDRDTIERHVGWANDAGIDVLVSAWFGPRDNNPTETNFKTLLDVAQASGLKVAILLETDNDDFFPSAGRAGGWPGSALATHAERPGLPPGRRPPGHLRLAAVGSVRAERRACQPEGCAHVAAWRAILDEVDPARRRSGSPRATTSPSSTSSTASSRTPSPGPGDRPRS